jgi:hypothetical protein
MQALREPLGLTSWIIRLVIVTATGLGFFHKVIALSQTDTATYVTPIVLETLHIGRMLELSARGCAAK